MTISDYICKHKNGEVNLMEFSDYTLNPELLNKLFTIHRIRKVILSQGLNHAPLRRLFADCEHLEEVDFGDIDTSQMLSIEGMFHKCSNLKKINFRNINTNNLINLDEIFYGCNKLKEIDLSKFTTNNVTSMNFTFWGCIGLKNLDLSNFYTPKLQYLESTFEYCRYLQKLNLNNFDLSDVRSFSHTFDSCEALEEIRIKNVQLYSNVELYNTFAYCLSLVNVPFVKHIKGLSYRSVGCFTNCKRYDKGYSEEKLINILQNDYPNLNREDINILYKGITGTDSEKLKEKELSYSSIFLQNIVKGM